MPRPRRRGIPSARSDPRSTRERHHDAHRPDHHRLHRPRGAGPPPGIALPRRDHRRPHDRLGPRRHRRSHPLRLRRPRGSTQERGARVGARRGSPPRAARPRAAAEPAHGPFPRPRRLARHRRGAALDRARRLRRAAPDPRRGVRGGRGHRERECGVGRRPGRARPDDRRRRARAALGRSLRLRERGGAAGAAHLRVPSGPPRRPPVGAPRRRPHRLHRRRGARRHRDRRHPRLHRARDARQLRRPRPAGPAARGTEADRHHAARGLELHRRRRARHLGRVGPAHRLRHPRGADPPPALVRGAPGDVPRLDQRDGRPLRRPRPQPLLAELLRHRRVPLRSLHERARARVRLRRRHHLRRRGTRG